MNYSVRETCQLCSGAIDKVLDLGSTPLANEYPGTPSPHQERFPLFLSACRDCGHVQMPVVVDPERLFREYRYQSGTTAAFRKHLAALAQSIANRCELAGNDLVVDIGSNDGTLLDEFAARGQRVLGVDPALNLAAEATARGVATLPTFFDAGVADTIVELAGHANVITALNVFAHSHELGEMAEGIAALLADDGTCVVEVGSSSSVTDGIFDLAYHEHAAFWSLSPLSRFLARHGLTVRAAETVGSQGGSIRAWIGHSTPANDGATEPPPPVVDWASVRANVEERREQIRRVVRGPWRIGMYGVPAKATTLLHYCGLTDVIAFAVDDCELKHGRYVPGTGIKILPANEIPQCDALLVCAWNFAEEIMERNAVFQGKFVIPFPEVRVV